MNTVKALLLATVAGFAAQAVCAAGLDELPPDLVKRLYERSTLDPAQPIGPSAYRDSWPKRPPPWTIGYASSYAGNTWRANAMDHLLKEVMPKWKQLGLVKDVIITQSNLNDSTQIQQMRQLVDQGVDAIFVCCSNPTALNQTVKYAFDKGVPTFSFTGYLTSPYSVNSSVNYQYRRLYDRQGDGRRTEGQRQRPRRRGHSRHVRLGQSGSRRKGGSRDRSRDQDRRVDRGQWTDQVAQGEVQKWLATHPGQLDGIVVQSAAELGRAARHRPVRTQGRQDRHRRRARRPVLLAQGSRTSSPPPTRFGRPRTRSS